MSDNILITFYYTFANLGPGVYRVREIPPSGFGRTTPNPADIQGISQATLVGVDFGNQLGGYLCPTEVAFDPLTGADALFICGTNLDDVFQITLIGGGALISVVINGAV